MIGAGSRTSTLADDAAVLLGLVGVDGLDSSCSIKLADDAVINRIPHKVRDLGHPTAPESERGDCLRCTTLSRGSLRAIDTASAGFRSSRSLLCGCRLLAARSAGCLWSHTHTSFEHYQAGRIEADSQRRSCKSCERPYLSRSVLPTCPGWPCRFPLGHQRMYSTR